MCGCYDMLRGGLASEALADLTGGGEPPLPPVMSSIAVARFGGESEWCTQAAQPSNSTSPNWSATRCGSASCKKTNAATSCRQGTHSIVSSTGQGTVLHHRSALLQRARRRQVVQHRGSGHWRPRLGLWARLLFDCSETDLQGSFGSRVGFPWPPPPLTSTFHAFTHSLTPYTSHFDHPGHRD